MGKSLEHKMLQGLAFSMRGLGGLVGRVGLVRDSNKAQRLSQKKSRASGGRCEMVLFFSAGLRLRFRA